MRVLYIFPHPDDESFGPANAMSKQIREGHEVYLLTLTKGGATKQRHKYNYTIEEMGEVRYKEMIEVAKVLKLTGMNVLDLPDSGLKEMDPREIEKVIKVEIESIRPDVVVTYPVHGISGFHDHLVTHAVVKRVYAELKANSPNLKRLAFYTIQKELADKPGMFNLSGSAEDEIDCIYEVDKTDIENSIKALDCYVTFKETIDASDIKNKITDKVYFEFYQEDGKEKLSDIFEKL
ncbi:MAG TPA: PIG-L family deacetylase [Ignavibacteria bacterium]|nr:PIG-L family deacetylase [Ignavibacteria bacterium]HMR39603.1 PIG-L family deacetylase [Ignavibacteria bacterium]